MIYVGLFYFHRQARSATTAVGVLDSERASPSVRLRGPVPAQGPSLFGASVGGAGTPRPSAGLPKGDGPKPKSTAFPSDLLQERGTYGMGC